MFSYLSSDLEEKFQDGMRKAQVRTVCSVVLNGVEVVFDWHQSL
jgi:hypothetical protein